MTAPRAEAEANQRAASDPAVSAFVAASAGSGKTRLLTDRLLRLMVGGAKPERILCLTFTKAAAAEMSVRLQRRLGEWVTMEPSALSLELRNLAIEPTNSTMTRARSLFALVLDLPGGMRIGTIHAFCQSLLRRFPLEAELSPHFLLAEDRDAAEAMTEAREDMLASVRPRGSSNALSDMEVSLRKLAGVVTLARFSELVTKLKWKHDPRRPGHAFGVETVAARRRILGLMAPDRAAVIAAAVAWPGEAAVREAAHEVEKAGAAKAQERAGGILEWLSLPPAGRRENWQAWRKSFVKDDGLPYAASTFVNPVLAKARTGLLPLLLAEADRVVSTEDQARAADTAEVSEALCDLAGPLLDRYEYRKMATGLLEFDDLIARSTALLIDPGADWVLYKLDGGLDHLLLDEVQDTAPEQWAIAHSLTQEFFSGDGARDETRTVFAVGDRKQSIFSFQGADVAGFDAARQRLNERVTRAGQRWVEKPLNVSFRSTSPVLTLVDAVFDDPLASAGVVLPGEILTHRADRAGHAGRVEIWPLAEAPTPEPPPSWGAPEGNQRATSAIQVLADNLAEWIKQQTDGSVTLESKGRPLRPGDIMILVRRRDTLPAALVRSLKSLGVPVAGLDRMVLTEQPAVQDLMILGDALLLPRDDLTFASLLTSPLGGLNDDDLMTLAIGRTRPVSDVLRARHAERSTWTQAWQFFSALLSRADYVTPHALFAEVLGALGGRAKLLARLGSEAADPIDELLNAAMRYTDTHPPSLQGFLQWLRRSGAEIKRQTEAAGDQVRILTVHNAKGLQAPVVILPDTTSLPPHDDVLLWDTDPVTNRDVPIWAPRREFHCNSTKRIRDNARQRRLEEHNRLLYVALTRAEDRAIICGARPKKGAPSDDCWYSAVTRGFTRLGLTPEDGFARLESSQTVGTENEPSASARTEATPPPAFLGLPPKPEPARPMPLAPSRSEGVELGAVPACASPLVRVEAGTDRFRRGQLIHTLLQHLPSLPEAEWQDAAARFLERPGHTLSPDTVAVIVAETMAILRHPALRAVFGRVSRAEVPLTGLVGDVVVGGLVDRIAVLPDRVLVADFKTNRRPPTEIIGTPVAYLRQMASYRAVLRNVFPGRAVECSLIWTREARVSVLPDALLDLHTPADRSVRST